MTLSELKKRCEANDIPYAYGKFAKNINPPHLVGTIIDSDNFAADNIVWSSISNFRLELTTICKDLEIQKVVENIILKDVFWDKTENYISSEEVYNTSYFFVIKED